jgi:GTPase SAR1 family protein
MTISGASVASRSLLGRYRSTHPDVIALAALASLARRIEPELLRRLRLELAHRFPAEMRPTVGSESKLWFSQLVETRGADSITLVPEVIEELRSELTSRGLVEDCYAVIAECHRAAPPVIRWEEELVRLGLSDEPAALERMRDLSLRAASAIRGGGREGLEEWIREMWPRLPPETARHPSVGRLRRAVDARRASGVVPETAATSSKRLEIGGAGGLRVGFLAGGGDYAFHVPLDEPSVLEVEDDTGRNRTVVVAEGAAVELEGFAYPLTLRTTDGREYALDAPAPPERSPDAPRELEGHAGPVWCVDVLSDGRVVSGSEDGWICTWDLEASAPTRVRRMGPVLSVAFSPSGRILAGGKNGELLVMGPAVPGLYQALSGHAGDINAIAVSADGRAAFTGSDDGTIRSHDLNEGISVPLFNQTSAPILDLALTKPGHLLAARGEPDVLLFRRRRPKRTKAARQPPPRWTLATVPTQLTTPSPVRSLAVSPDGRFLVAGGFDGTLTYWDLDEEALVRTLVGHTGPIYAVRIAPDGRRAVTVSGDRTLRTWDLDTGAQERVFHADVELVGLALLRDGAGAVTGSAGNQAFVWDLGERAGRDLDDEGQRVATVVLLGEDGAGKTSLANALASERYTETHATHGRIIRQILLTDSTTNGRSVRLFDIAARGDWVRARLLLPSRAHLAIVVVDFLRDEALDVASKWLSLSQAVAPGRVLLVAARSDRGGPTPAQVQRLGSEYTLLGVFETSAKTGTGITELRNALAAQIDWSSVPPVHEADVARVSTLGLRALKLSAPALRLRALTDALAQDPPSPDFDDETVRRVMKQLSDEGTVLYVPSSDTVVLRPNLLASYLDAVLTARDYTGGTLAVADILDGRFMPSEFPDRAGARELSRVLVDLLLERGACFTSHLAGSPRLVFQDPEPDVFARLRPTFALEVVGAPEHLFLDLVSEVRNRFGFARIGEFPNGVELRTPDGKSIGIGQQRKENGIELMLSFEPTFSSSVRDEIIHELSRIVHERFPAETNDQAMPRQTSSRYPTGGAVPLDDGAYLQRAAEGAVFNGLQDRGVITLYGPHQSGKSSVLVRVRQRLEQAGLRFLLLDTTQFAHAGTTFPEFCQELTYALDAHAQPLTTPAMLETRGFESFLKRELAKALERLLAIESRPLVLAFEEIDTLLRHGFMEDFASMLRSWHNRSVSNDGWQNLRLLLVSSQSPASFDRNTYASPFMNVARALKVGWFTRAECAELNQRLQARLDENAVEAVFRLIQGQPYLTRLAFHLLASGLPIDELLETALHRGGPFEEHLQMFEGFLGSRPETLEAFRAILKGQQPKDHAALPFLESLGLVRVDGTDGKNVEPANDLYLRHFRKSLL